MLTLPTGCRCEHDPGAPGADGAGQAGGLLFPPVDGEGERPEALAVLGLAIVVNDDWAEQRDAVELLGA
ncbi:hypothetical protein [Streptomyces sp. NPDC017991]|uniref:hypothetical protein n=1 Tax=Streptomyces sp. NPDC017991 TaxID=3365026 RepID=UPI003792F466